MIPDQCEVSWWLYEFWFVIFHLFDVQVIANRIIDQWHVVLSVKHTLSKRNLFLHSVSLEFIRIVCGILDVFSMRF